MIAPLYRLLRDAPAPAADAVLLEALRLGDPDEAAAAAEALFARSTPAGLAGLVSAYSDLPPATRDLLAAGGARLDDALAKSCRGDDSAARVAACRVVADGGKLGLLYLLPPLLRCRATPVADAAAAALAKLASVAGSPDDVEKVAAATAAGLAESPRSPAAADRLHEAAVALLAAGATDEQLRDAARRGPTADALRRRAAAGDPAALLAAARVPTAARSALAEGLAVAPDDALAAVARLAGDERVAAALRDAGIAGRRSVHTAAGLDDAAVEELAAVLDRPADKGRLLRTLAARELPVPTDAVAALVADENPRVRRIAARLLARVAVARGPDAAAAERLLLRRCAAAPADVRRAASRGLHAAFDGYLRRFDDLPADRRRAAGAAVVKLLPDAAGRLNRLASTGPSASRLKALRVAAELGLCRAVADAITAACGDADARLRSKAVLLLADVFDHAADAASCLEAALEDGDPRVRANAVETLAKVAGGRSAEETRRLLAARARLGRNRERANAIVAMGELKLAPTDRPLFDMLRDRRDAHRLSAVWAAERTHDLRNFEELARLARGDANPGVRRSALSAVRRIAEHARRGRPAKAAAVLLALLLPAASATASDMAAFSAGFGDAAGDSPDLTPWLLGGAMLASGGLAVGLLAAKLRRRFRDRRDGPLALERAAARLLRLGRTDLSRLRRLSAAAGCEHAVTLLVCPSLLARLRPDAVEGDRLMLDRVLSRLAG